MALIRMRDIEVAGTGSHHIFLAGLVLMKNQTDLTLGNSLAYVPGIYHHSKCMTCNNGEFNTKYNFDKSKKRQKSLKFIPVF